MIELIAFLRESGKRSLNIEKSDHDEIRLQLRFCLAGDECGINLIVRECESVERSIEFMVQTAQLHIRREVAER